MPLLLMPNWLGFTGALIVFGILQILVPALEQIDSTRAHELEYEDFIGVVERLAICIAAGLSIPDSLRHAATSRQTPATRQIESALQLYDLGQDLPSVIQGIAVQNSQWTPVVAVLNAGYLHGAPTVGAFDAILEHLYAAGHHKLLTKIRRVSVQSVIPLGCCFLPAFIILTVVPIVASFVSQLDW